MFAGLSDSSTATEVAKKQAAMQQHQRQNQSDGRVILSPPYSGGLPPSHYLQPPIAGETTSLYSSVSPYYYPTPAPGAGALKTDCFTSRLALFDQALQVVDTCIVVCCL